MTFPMTHSVEVTRLAFVTSPIKLGTSALTVMVTRDAREAVSVLWTFCNEKYRYVLRIRITKKKRKTKNKKSSYKTLLDLTCK